MKERILFGLLKAKVRGKAVPLLASVHITNVCNLKCTYCYASLDSSENKEPTTKELLNRFDVLIKNGTRMIRLLGGEPLLRKDLNVLVDYLKERKVWVEITTNGTNAEKWVNTLKKVDSICLSIDGDKETNNKCRGNNAYQTTIKALKIIRKDGVPVRLHGVVTKHNAYNFKSLIHLGELAKSVKGSFGYSQCLMPETHPDADLTPSQIKSFYSLLKKAKQLNYPIITSPVFLKHIKHFPDKLTITENEKNAFTVSCTAGKYHCFVDTDGRMYSCTGTWRTGLSMDKVGFEKAWSNLSERNCFACLASGEVEADAVFNLNLRALLHGVVTY